MAENDCPLCKPNQQPTAKLLAAMAEAENGQGITCSTIEELMAALDAEDDQSEPGPAS
jgi:hypothetical protein